MSMTERERHTQTEMFYVYTSYIYMRAWAQKNDRNLSVQSYETEMGGGIGAT